MPTPQELLTSLSRPEAYPYAVSEVIVHQTHISMVFVAGDFVYKIKKPVQLGFLDFSTLDRRRHFCAEEIRLNRRLAPQVYLDIVSVVNDSGNFRFEAKGEPVEWAVKMRRLPDKATLESRLNRNEVTPLHLNQLAGRLARFHAEAAASVGGSAREWHERIVQNFRENFEQTEKHQQMSHGPMVVPEVWSAVRDATEAVLNQEESLLTRRAEHHLRDTHGDLHLDHVYHFPDQPPPDDWVIIDCIEFNERFRHADPIADIAFLVMDLAYHGRRDLAETLVRAYADASGDAEGMRLLPLYSSYRAVVRAKVEGMKALEQEVSEEDRIRAKQEARAHWLLARDELVAKARRSALVVVCGLPGTGKSAVSEALSRANRFTWIRSDAVRKELAQGRTEVYSSEWTERTYHEVARRAEEALFRGQRVLIDANFRLDWQRELIRDLSRRWHVPLLFLECRTSQEAVKRRLEARRGDISDADWSVYEKVAGQWEVGEGPAWAILDTSDALEDVVERAREELSTRGLI